MTRPQGPEPVAETFSEAVHRLRGDLSLRALARRAHLDPGHLSRVLNGRRPVNPGLAADLDRALDAGGQLVALARPLPWQLDGGLWRPQESERLAGLIIGTDVTPDTATELAHAWLISEPPQIYERRSGRHIGADLVKQIEQRVHQLRLIDDHVGGTETFAMVSAELDATIGVLTDGAYTEDLGKRLLVAVGELCQLAGWTASDAGRYADAQRLYLAGVRASHAGGDTPGAANNLSSLAYQVANVGDPREAVNLARSAYAGGRREATPTSRALLAERIAWSTARAGDAGDAGRALGKVQDEYGHRRDDDHDPLWAYWLDESEVEIMEGRVWTQLRRPLRAVPILERATRGYGDETGRETALYLTWLAESLIQANEPERAAVEATRALRLSRNAASVRAADRVRVIRRQLSRFAGNHVVDAFQEEAAE